VLHSLLELLGRDQLADVFNEEVALFDILKSILENRLRPYA
jgi:hypothetical protein